jgi:ElaB/YqjD/DUF883 family membrane-anchored ribosome-binding protein
MGEQIEGVARPALAAHSKDASAKGPTTASSTTGKTMPPGSGDSGPVGDLANRVRDAAARAASSVSDAADVTARQTVRAADEATEFVHQQPLVALLATGAICFMLGLVLRRR